jgi:hypothetical protein
VHTLPGLVVAEITPIFFQLMADFFFLLFFSSWVLQIAGGDTDGGFRPVPNMAYQA